MKGIAKALLVLIVPVFISAGNPELPTSQQVISQPIQGVRLSEGDIVNYLQGLGYTVVTSDPIGGGCNWICETYYGGLHYNTTVFTNCNAIIGHEDVDY